MRNTLLRERRKVVMSFDQMPIIPASNVFRAAMVSAERGNRAVKELIESRAIEPTITPTGRWLFTLADGRRVFEKIVNGD